MKEEVAIYSGNFAVSGTGNFNAYTAKRKPDERIHVPANLMKAFGYTEENEDKIQYPFYATVTSIVRNALVPTLDKDGNPELDKNGSVVRVQKLDKDGNPETFTRYEAGALFKTKGELIQACNADTEIEMEVKADLVSKAKKLDLTAEVLKELQVAF